MKKAFAKIYNLFSKIKDRFLLASSFYERKILYNYIVLFTCILISIIFLINLSINSNQETDNPHAFVVYIIILIINFFLIHRGIVFQIVPIYGLVVFSAAIEYYPSLSISQDVVIVAQLAFITLIWLLISFKWWHLIVHLFNSVTIITIRLIKISNIHNYGLLSETDFHLNLNAYIYLFFTILICLLFYFLINREIRLSTREVKHIFHKNLLEEQISRQLVHYKSYSRYTEKCRAFRHDFSKHISLISSLLRNQNFEKALEIIDSIEAKSQKELETYKTFSNNLILDAILQDACMECADKDIIFEAFAFLPESTRLSDLEIVSVFSNAINNAIEACSRVRTTYRFIKVNSEKVQQWLVIGITNSFNGDLKYKNGKYHSTKPNSSMHGLGINILKETIENYGGMVLIEPDLSKKVFQIRIYLPNE